MTIREQEINLFWAECVDVFKQIEGISSERFLLQLIEIVKKHDESITKLLNKIHSKKKYTFADSEKEFFKFITGIDPNIFVLGSTGDDFEVIVTNYVLRAPSSGIEAWRRISNIVRDLTTFTSQIVCPKCKSDHLRILTDVDGIRVYKSCESCSFIESGGQVFQRSELLLPANRFVLVNSGFLE